MRRFHFAKTPAPETGRNGRHRDRRHGRREDYWHLPEPAAPVAGRVKFGELASEKTGEYSKVHREELPTAKAQPHEQIIHTRTAEKKEEGV
jgi:hypothetical protein